MAQPRGNIWVYLWERRDVLLQEGHIVPVERIPDVVLSKIGTQIEGNRTVILTLERRLHYLQRHPEMAKWESIFPNVINNPDEVHKNRRNSQIFNFYKRISEKHYLRLTVVIQEKPGKFKHSIITARLARIKEVQRGQKKGLKIWP